MMRAWPTDGQNLGPYSSVPLCSRLMEHWLTVCSDGRGPGFSVYRSDRIKGLSLNLLLWRDLFCRDMPDGACANIDMNPETFSMPFVGPCGSGRNFPGKVSASRMVSLSSY